MRAEYTNIHHFLILALRDLYQTFYWRTVKNTAPACEMFISYHRTNFVANRIHKVRESRSLKKNLRDIHILVLLEVQ